MKKRKQERHLRQIDHDHNTTSIILVIQQRGGENSFHCDKSCLQGLMGNRNRNKKSLPDTRYPRFPTEHLALHTKFYAAWSSVWGSCQAVTTQDGGDPYVSKRKGLGAPPFQTCRRPVEDANIAVCRGKLSVNYSDRPGTTSSETFYFGSSNAIPSWFLSSLHRQQSAESLALLPVRPATGNQRGHSF
jgi:hypothetical protein